MSATLTMSTLPIQTFTKSYQADLLTEVKRRRKVKVLRKKVLKELKKETERIKPAKTKVKSKAALKKAAEKAAKKATDKVFKDMAKAAERVEKADAKRMIKEAKQREKLLKKIDSQNYGIQFDREGCSIRTLRRIIKEIPNMKRADAKLDKAEAERVKTVETLKKKTLAIQAWASKNGLSLQDFVVNMQNIVTELNEVETSNFVTIIDTENPINAM
jgi:hypothetical protein